jgi:putative transposase
LALRSAVEPRRIGQCRRAYEWLDLYIFETIEEVQQIATEWLWTYNNERPNMGIGGVTPAMKLKMAA